MEAVSDNQLVIIKQIQKVTTKNLERKMEKDRSTVVAGHQTVTKLPNSIKLFII